MSTKSTHKKTTNKGSAKSAPKRQAAKTGGRNKLIVAGIVAAVLIGLIAVVLGNGAKGSSGGVGTASAAPGEEQKYLGRLLPAGYEEPSIGKTTIYTSAVNAKTIQATDDGTSLSVPLDKIKSDKIVLFNYSKPGSAAIPVLAYVKPSGKLFVGVSFCPPCKGVGQRIEPDMTLTCATCGTKRQLETMIGVSGACKLYPLDEVPSKIQGGKLVIDKAALDGWTAQPLDRPVGG